MTARHDTPMPQLSADQAELLRHVAVRSQYRRVRGRRVPAAFSDGPLSGVRVTVPESEARSQFIGWCLPTPIGVVQVLYRRERGRCVFDGAELCSV